MTPDRYAEILKLARERFPEGAAALHMHGLGLLGGLLDALEELQRIDPEKYSPLWSIRAERDQDHG